MDFLIQAFDVIRHLDVHLSEWIVHFGPSIYFLLFAIIFCETGLVVTPFLPGDSLLFALGAFAAGESAPLDLKILLVSLIVAGILGDAVNYFVGKWIGPKVFSKENSRWFNKNHLVRTQHFYEKYGAKTIILARFIPIVRTFAPFVAGIGKMKYSKFGFYNVIGAVAWVGLFLLAGFYFGNLPTVKTNFHLVIIAIVVISAIPPVIEVWKSRRAGENVGA
jgi:membrane-associated protein